MTISSLEDADDATVCPEAARDPQSSPVRAARTAPTMTPPLEAFLLDRFGTRLEDPLTGKKVRVALRHPSLAKRQSVIETPLRCLVKPPRASGGFFREGRRRAPASRGTPVPVEQ